MHVNPRWARETARRFLVAALLPLPAAADADASHAATAAAAAAPTSDARPTLVVRVRSDSRELVPAAVREAVARELGVLAVEPPDVTSRAPAELTVTYRASAAELAVTYVHPSIGVLTRVVAAPAAVVDVPEAAALLASNLARTAEGDLLLPPIAAPPVCPPTSNDPAHHGSALAASDAAFPPRLDTAHDSWRARRHRSRRGTDALDVHALAWASNTAYGNVGVKLVGRTSYALFALTGHSSSQSGLIGPGVLFGVAVRVTPSVFLDTDFGASHLFATASGTAGAFYSADNRVLDLTVIKLRAIVRYALPSLSTFYGLGINDRIRYKSSIQHGAAFEALAGIEL